MGRYDNKITQGSSAATPEGVCAGCTDTCFLVSCKNYCRAGCQGTSTKSISPPSYVGTEK